MEPLACAIRKSSGLTIDTDKLAMLKVGTAWILRALPRSSGYNSFEARVRGHRNAGMRVTGISGTFSDSNNGLNIVNAPIGPLEPIKHDTPESTNLLAPNDFSRFAVAAGLSPTTTAF